MNNRNYDDSIKRPSRRGRADNTERTARREFGMDYDSQYGRSRDSHYDSYGMDRDFNLSGSRGREEEFGLDSDRSNQRSWGSRNSNFGREQDRNYNLGTGTTMSSQERGMGSREWDRNYHNEYYGAIDSERGMGRDTGRRDFDRQSGGFFGKGPKGWKRSDEKIKDLVCEALHDSYMVDASEIDVTVKDGNVTLSGSVDGRDSKREAERCVESLRGVVDVQNELKVKRAENISDIRRSGAEPSSGKSASLS